MFPLLSMLIMLFGLLVSLLTEHFKLAGPDLRHGKLCRYKESVHKNQEYYYQRIKYNLKKIHRNSFLLSSKIKYPSAAPDGYSAYGL